MQPCIDDLEGHWRTTENKWCRVSRDTCTFRGCERSFQINVERGQLILNDWVAIEVGENYVKWKLRDRTLEWHRTRPEELNGIWLDAGGSFRNVSAGSCTYSSGDVHPITLQVGQLIRNGWAATQVAFDYVDWEREGVTITWRRVEPDALDGIWRSSHGAWCKVVAGACDFGDGSGSFTIRLTQQGALSMNNWVVAALDSDVVSWRRGERSLEWHRPRPQDLDGMWRNTDNVKVSVAGGLCSFSREGGFCPISAKGGLLHLNDWISAGISADRVTWKRGDETTTWRRESASESPRGNKRERDAECTLCLSAPQEVAFDPCGHLATCSSCATDLTACPICREQIVKRLRVFSP